MKWLVAFPENGEMDAAIREGCRNNGIEVDGHDARKHAFTLYQKICAGKYDVVMMSRTLELYPSFIRAKDRFPETKFLIWNPDSRDSINQWGPLLQFFKEVDYYFMMDETDLGKVRELNKNTYYLPQGIHEEVYHEVELNEEDHAKYDCDISFIGSIIQGIHNERPAVIDALQHSGYDFKVFDNIWKDEHNKVVQCSKINLSCEHSPDKKGYFSVRNYKVIACGGVCIDLYHEGLEKLFGKTDSDECACYYFKNPAEAIEISREILNNYTAYKKKAENFREIALKEHTYTERIGRIKELLETGEFRAYS